MCSKLCCRVLIIIRVDVADGLIVLCVFGTICNHTPHGIVAQPLPQEIFDLVVFH